MEYNSLKKEIISSRKLSLLDKFVVDFIRVLRKHIDYVIISGYVSILLGRTRVTEDIDIFIKRINKEQFSKLYEELKEKGFWCLNAEKTDEIYSFLEDGLAVRFAKQNNSIPNIEMKFPKDALDEDAFNDSINVVLSEDTLKISSFERHIAFKRYFLSSDKDIEDALHIEELFKEYIDTEKIKNIKKLIENRKNGAKKNFS